MGRSSRGTIPHIQQLMDNAKYEEALSSLEEIQSARQLTKDKKLATSLLKVRIYLAMRNFEEALHTAKKLVPKSILSKRRLTKTQLRKIQPEIFEAVILTAGALRRLGKLPESLQLLEKSECILETLEQQDSSRSTEWRAKLAREKGGVRFYQGELELTLEYYQECLGLFEKLENQPEIAYSLNDLGVIYGIRGEIDLAIEYFLKSITLNEKVKRKSELPKPLTNIGICYSIKGELDQALEYHQKSLALAKELGHHPEIAEAYKNIGYIYQSKGEFKQALAYYEKSLDLFQQLGNNVTTSESLYHLIILEAENNLKDAAWSHLQQLQQINDVEDNKVIGQRYRLAQSMVLGSDARLKDLAEAQNLLKEIVEEEIVDSELTIFAILNLCNSLIEELHFLGQESILKELEQYSGRLLATAKSQNSHRLLVESYLLQSKLAVLEWDIEKGKDLLHQAFDLASEKGLGKLAIEISKEQDQLLRRIETWTEGLGKEISLLERVELAQLDEFIIRMVRSRTSAIQKKTEELSEFAHSMAHDLKSKITVILGYTSIIEQRGYEKEHLEKISSAAESMIDLLDHSLELADAGLIVERADEVDFNQLLDEIAKSTLPDHVTFSRNQLPRVICDKSRIEQVFRNLFLNAVIHGESTKNVIVTSEASKEGIHLLITNDGTPIPIEERDKIFDRGYTTKKGHMGLGLAIVKKLVEAHGWKILMDPSSTTTFRITIPFVAINRK